MAPTSGCAMMLKPGILWRASTRELSTNSSKPGSLLPQVKDWRLIDSAPRYLLSSLRCTGSQLGAACIFTRQVPWASIWRGRRRTITNKRLIQVAQWGRIHLPSRRLRTQGFDLWVGKNPWSGHVKPLSLLTRKSHGQRSPEGDNPWYQRAGYGDLATT